MSRALQRISATGIEAPEGISGPRLRHVNSAYPVLTGFKTNDYWVDTTTEGSTGSVFRRWTGSAFVPAPSSPALLEQFTGTNGAAWNVSNWTTGVTPGSGTGYGATISGNTGKLACGNGGNFPRISMQSTVTSRADASFAFSFKMDGSLVFLDAYQRANTSVNGATGYFMTISRGYFTISKTVAFSVSTLQAATFFPYFDNQWYSARFSVVGTALNARVWRATDPEPGTWMASVTDSAITASGVLGFNCAGDAAAVASQVYLDDVVIS